MFSPTIFHQRFLAPSDEGAVERSETEGENNNINISWDVEVAVPYNLMKHYVVFWGINVNKKTKNQPDLQTKVNTVILCKFRRTVVY